MIYTVGIWWLIIYLFLAVVLLFLAFKLFAENVTGGAILCLVFSLLFGYFSFYAGSHFRVKIVERALLINTVRGEVIGVRGPGVQSRPLLGASIETYPANKALEVYLDLDSDCKFEEELGVQ